jgi:hypothetical protein
MTGARVYPAARFASTPMGENSPVRRLLIPAALAVALTAPATAAAPRVITLNWEEAARSGGQSVMTFKVDKITFTGSSWRVTGAYTNTSTKTIRLVEPWFSLRAFRTRAYGPNARFRRFKALSLSPRPPRTLAPGQTWRGGFGGPGLPGRGRFVRVVFGDFAPAFFNNVRAPWAWVTDHTFRY